MQTHKDSMHRTLNEKSQEHAKEKESLIDLYQGKFADYETREKTLLKEIKERAKNVSNLKPSVADAQSQTEDDEENNAEYIESLHNRIAQLEGVLSNTDAHFELELEKLRQELDDDYQAKLKYELEREELQRRQLEHELETLKHQLDNNDEEVSASFNSSTNKQSWVNDTFFKHIVKF